MSMMDEQDQDLARPTRLFNKIPFPESPMHQQLKSGLSKVLDFILPPICIHCQKAVCEHGQLCGNCWGHIHFITNPLCDRTGLPLPYDVNHNTGRTTGQNMRRITPEKSGEPQFSSLAIAHPPNYDRARSVAIFGDVMRDLVHGLKYGDRREGLALFGRWMVFAGRTILPEADLIVPVPLYRFRLWQRRFNQSALLAQEITRLTGVPTKMRVLQRRRATQSQVGLSETQRRKNVSGAFMVPTDAQSSIKDRNIVLIDDVLTTGATVNACTWTLKKAGAKRVDVLVLARTSTQEMPGNTP